MLPPKRKCTACGFISNLTAIEQLKVGQWWHFSEYTTKISNTYNGFYCPDCSDKIYSENKEALAMTNKITIITNNQPRNVLRSHDLTEKERAEFDYLDEEQIEWASFFRYNGQVYDLGEFVSLVERSRQVGFEHGCDEASPLLKWHGIATESYFSGLLVRYADSDCESVIVGRYYS